jgi:predicted phage replisome organizer
MADVKWIKIVTDIFDDEKIFLIESLPSADSILVIWFKLLCLAGKNNNDGVFIMSNRIAYTDEMLAAIFRREVNTVRLALSTFEKYGMIEVINDAITIPNWDKYQSLDGYEKKKERDRIYQKKRREKQKLLVENTQSSDMSSDCSADVVVSEEEREEEEERERDKEEDKNIKKEKRKSEFDVIIESYTDDLQLRNTIYEFIKMRKAIRASMTSNALKLMLGKLDKLATNNQDKKAILEQSIMNSWKGIFELKEGSYGNSNRSSTENTTDYKGVKRQADIHAPGAPTREELRAAEENGEFD